MTETIEIGGREVVAFAELSEKKPNRTTALYPIPLDGGHGWTFGEANTGTIEIWGVKSDRGKRIADAYERGDLPSQDTDELNRVLRPDEFEDERRAEG